MRIFVSSIVESSIIISSLYITQIILNTNIPVTGLYFVIMILSIIIISSIIAEIYNRKNQNNQSDLITTILKASKNFLTQNLLKGVLLSLTASFLTYIAISAIASIKNILISINILHFISVSSITIFIVYFYFNLIERIITKQNETNHSWKENLKLALYSITSVAIITNGLYFALERYFPQLITSVLEFIPMPPLLTFNLFSLVFTLALFIYKIKNQKIINAMATLKLIAFIITFSSIFATITTLLSTTAITIMLEQGFFALFSQASIQALATPFLFGLLAGALSSIIVRNIVNQQSNDADYDISINTLTPINQRLTGINNNTLPTLRTPSYVYTDLTNQQ